MRKERLRSVVLCCLGLGISLSFLFLSKIIIRLYVAIFEFGASQMEWFRSAKPGGGFWTTVCVCERDVSRPVFLLQTSMNPSLYVHVWELRI